MYLQAHAKALAELRRQVGETVTTDAEAVMCNFAERLAKDARLHHEVEAIVATALLSHKGVAELREVCTQWFKRQAFPLRRRNDKRRHEGDAALPRRRRVVRQLAEAYRYRNRRIARQKRDTRAI